MTRTPVKSSLIASVGHDETGMEVQFHNAGCLAKLKIGDCNCEQGPVYHYPTVTAEQHGALMAAKSPGGHFTQHIRPHHTGVKRG